MTEGALIDVTLHDVGEGLAEAQIVEWLVAPGQRVAEDQSIVVVATDKANVELPAPVSGVLHEQLVSAGTTVAVGTLLGRIRRNDGTEAGTSAPKGPLTLPSPPRGRGEVHGAPPTRRGETRRVPLDRLRLATARATSAAWREIPHIVEFRQADATVLKKARESHGARAEREGLRLTFLPFFVKATCVALTKHPRFNARLDLERQELLFHQHCNIGIAAASEAGLSVPVLHQAEGRSVFQLAGALDTLIGKARDQSLSPSDLAEGTFTLTNFGSYGTWLGTPIIRAPEVAIVGFGRIYDGVLAIDGSPVVRPLLPISLATDHRVNDGVHLAAFLDTLAEALGDAALMSDDSRGEHNA